MPALKNPKHEAFARALAKGETQVEAYRMAGYQPNDGHAARLAGNGMIPARVQELLEKVAKKTVVTIETIAAQLDEDRQLARESGQSAAAVSATMGKAKLFGLLIDKVQADVRHTFAELSDAELDSEIARLMQEVGVTAH